jgi:hypothetical protein
MTQRLIPFLTLLWAFALQTALSQKPNNRPPGYIVIDDVCTIRDPTLEWSNVENFPLTFYPSAANQRSLTVPFEPADCNYFSLNIGAQLFDGRRYASSNYMSVLYSAESWCYVDSMSVHPLYLMDGRAEDYFVGLDLPDEVIVNSINYALGTPLQYPGEAYLTPAEITALYDSLMLYEVRLGVGEINFKFHRRVLSADVDLKINRECLPKDEVPASRQVPFSGLLIAAPPSASAFITYTVDQTCEVSLEVFDKLGRLQSIGFNKRHHIAGTYIHELETDALGRDVYFLVVRSSDGRVLSKPFFKP